MLNMRLARPSTIVDITKVPGLDETWVLPDRITVGARMTHHDLARVPQLTSVRALGTAISEIGFQAIRHRGTIGGSLAHADPAAELATVLLALDASVNLTSSNGERRLPMDDFLVGYYSTARRADELVTSVDIPLPIRLVTGFSEFSRRPGDFGLALCAAAVWEDHGVPTARVVVGGLDVRARRLPVIEQTLLQSGVAAAVEVTTPELLSTTTSPSTDIHGSTDYRLQVGAEITRRALSQVDAWEAA